MLCHVKITNIDKQLGEVRTRFPGGKRELICRDCLMAKARATLGR